ncbi:hypothetical protein [Flavivirga sp. 57AJ16]|uniref:hypothetical protein n=1 Tax=Flavivirga sp. 57AJ16 TaxID=3025307 RepID=UPI002366D27B|nr:hypothetical protein [Flavivirga sp. 57AJ16]MDD7887322.1 hypothetical protein [Flavivirga sp. 57AJ16]
MLVLTLFSCKSDETSIEEDLESPLYNGLGIIETENDKYPLILQHIDGDRIVTIDNDLNGEMDGYLFSNSKDSFLVEINEENFLPSKITLSDESILMFSYREDNSVMDLGFIDANGNIEYSKDIDISEIANLNSNFKLESKSNNIKNLNKLKNIKNALFAISLGINVNVCAYSLALLNAPLAIISCGSAIFNTIDKILEEKQIENVRLEQANDLVNVIGTLSNTFGCINPVNRLNGVKDCINSVIDLSNWTLEVLNKINENKSEDIEDIQSEFNLSQLGNWVNNNGWSIEIPRSSCNYLTDIYTGLEENSSYIVFLVNSNGEVTIGKGYPYFNFLDYKKHKVTITSNTISVEVIERMKHKSENTIITLDYKFNASFDEIKKDRGTAYLDYFITNDHVYFKECAEGVWFWD